VEGLCARIDQHMLTKEVESVGPTSFVVVKVKANPGEGDDVANGSVVPSVAHPVSIGALGRPAEDELASDLSKVATARLDDAISLGA
jgi:hypothetical protein